MDEISLAAVGASALTGGVAFLYEQAGELLRARRERAGASDDPAAVPPLPVLEPPAEHFEAAPGTAVATAREDALDELAPRLQRSREEVHSYLDGTAAEDLGSPAGARAADRLRTLLEQVYGRPLTLRGEDRAAAPGASTRIDVRHGGVHAGGDITVRGGSLAGRDVRG